MRGMPIPRVFLEAIRADLTASSEATNSSLTVPCEGELCGQVLPIPRAFLGMFRTEIAASKEVASSAPATLTEAPGKAQELVGSAHPNVFFGMVKLRLRVRRAGSPGLG